MSRELRIVPYNHSLAAERSRAAANGLGAFLQRGGRIRPMELGAAATPSATTEDAAEEEGLIRGDRRYVRGKYYGDSVFSGRVLLCGIMSLLFVSIAVFVGLGVVVYRVNTQMDSVRATLSPHASTIMNATMDMLEDTRSTLHNMDEMTKSGVSFGHASVPEMNAMAAHTANITKKLKEMLAHPILKLSLE